VLAGKFDTTEPDELTVLIDQLNVAEYPGIFPSNGEFKTI
jgi:hypothetical protein